MLVRVLRIRSRWMCWDWSKRGPSKGRAMTKAWCQVQLLATEVRQSFVKEAFYSGGLNCSGKGAAMKTVLISLAFSCSGEHKGSNQDVTRRWLFMWIEEMELLSLPSMTTQTHSFMIPYVKSRSSGGQWHHCLRDRAKKKANVVPAVKK